MMTNYQLTFKRSLQLAFVDQRRDMARALVWMANHYSHLPRNYSDAYRALSSSEKNAVIQEVLTDVQNS